MDASRRPASPAMPAVAERKARLLERINARLPAGIDWKEGAATYLGNLIDQFLLDAASDASTSTRFPALDRD